MLDLKRSAIISGAAFIISFIVGLLGGTSAPSLYTRPFIFAFVFLALSILISMLVTRFLPELIEMQNEPPDVELPGSKIDIREGDAAVPDALYARPDESDQDIGNINDISKAVAAAAAASGIVDQGGQPLDQGEQTVYTEQGKGLAQETGDGFGALADLDSLAGAFVSSSGDKENAQEDDEVFSTSETPKKSSSGNKSPTLEALEGDFKPQELANGIRTILSKKEG